jgi:hypothetical protein
VNIPVLPKFSPRTPEEQYAAIERKLIRREAKIGGKLFGPLPKGHDRQFFCLDEHTWVWHENWTDKNGQRHTLTTRYEIRPEGILKVQNGRYQQLTRNEVKNLLKAAELYQDRVFADYDRMLQHAA